MGKTKKAYSKGELNQLIDSVLHPFAKGENVAAVLLLDGLLHAAVEQDPGQSLQKFIQYSLPKILEADKTKPKRARLHRY